LEFEFPSSGLIFWSVFVNGGKDIRVEYDACVKSESGIGPNKKEALKCEEFHREIFEVPTRMSGAKLTVTLDNRSSVFFSKTIEFVIAPYPDIYHDASSIITPQ